MYMYCVVHETISIYVSLQLSSMFRSHSLLQSGFRIMLTRLTERWQKWQQACVCVLSRRIYKCATHPTENVLEMRVFYLQTFDYYCMLRRGWYVVRWTVYHLERTRFLSTV